MTAVDQNHTVWAIIILVHSITAIIVAVIVDNEYQSSQA